MTPRKLKPKKCKVCKQEFMPFQPLQFICLEMSCLTSYTNACKQRAETRRRTNERRLIREARLKNKKRSEWLKDVEHWCNKVVRYRDKDDGCISCGTRNPNIQYAAGHFRTVKAAPQLRFNLDNIHRQCNYHCNSKLSGNRENYEPALVKKIGQERVDALKNNNEIHRYTIEECKELIIYFKQLYKELQHASS
jgi:hypothetical protein